MRLFRIALYASAAPGLALALGLGLIGCAAKPAETHFVPDDYSSWRRTTEITLNYPIPGHQDRFRLPRMNALGFGAVPATQNGKLHWDFPAGTVIAKEVYATMNPGPSDKPIQLTIMVKAPQDPRSQGGWIWLTRDMPDGKESVFAGNYCVFCHANANEKHPYGDGNPKEEFRDYVYFVPGEAEPPGSVESPGEYSSGGKESPGEYSSGGKESGGELPGEYSSGGAGLKKVELDPEHSGHQHPFIDTEHADR